MSEMESLSLNNKVAVVTGASSGLGLAIAAMFARRGASVVLCGRSQERLDAAVDQCVEAIGGHSDRFISVSGNLTEAGVRQSIVDRTVEKFGKLDILVPNAGMMLSEGEGIRNATEESYDTLMNTNLKSVFFLIQAALPELEKSKGNIVSMSSVGSTWVGMKDGPLYMMSKAALDHMTSCLALDLAPSGIRINAVNPSYVPTKILRNLAPDQQFVDKLTEAESSKTPLRGQCVTAEAVAEMVAFLASDAADCITGQSHIVDSGRHFMSLIEVQ